MEPHVNAPASSAEVPDGRPDAGAPRDEPGGVLVPSALVRPGGGTGAGSAGREGEPPVLAPPPAALARPAPLLESVGQIAGLSPRRRRGDGGEVPGADVDLADALPRTGERASWPTVAAWLQAGRSAATRRARLADLCAFLRWLEKAAPHVGLWDVTEDTVVAYRDQIAAGTGAAAGLNRGGRPLAPSSVARRLSSLASLYAYALRRHTVAANPCQHVERPEVGGAGATPARPLAEATALLDGAEAIADRYPVDAAAAALLICTGLRAAEVCGLTAGRITDDSGHRVLRVRVKGGKTLAVPLPPRVRVLLDPLLDGRAGHELVFVREGGRPLDRWRLTTALRRAACAAGVDHTRLTPHVLRATAATLLLDAGVPVDRVQAMLGHASPVTTQRYDRGEDRLDGHATYRLSSLLGGGT
ncbi:tyrosine-type recombinase/integrase [Actinomadura sp. WMMB 499]|uniref:tyrosine-type recombinase/integrase n=1 Tax=Actinomadura sp. WMMB 499 TaxID=1219491 RepID=UPI0012444443|nr:tyrosine-type recombinase/integrase [Actinomadura sp. WMMB 499]QFG22867.1 tyrosine-type recombinase/integrase [Actinomadura sp. WMMB 499]